MNWDAISAVSDSVGAIAVVITLWYLAVQIRDARRSSESEGTLASTGLASRWRTNFLRNNELTQVVAKANEAQPLSEQEKLQLHVLCEELFIIAAAGYTTTRQTGGLHDQAGEIEWLMNYLNANPGLIPEWHRQKRFIRAMSVPFIDIIDSKLAENGAPSSENEMQGKN